MAVVAVEAEVFQIQGVKTHIVVLDRNLAAFRHPTENVVQLFLVIQKMKVKKMQFTDTKYTINLILKFQTLPRQKRELKLQTLIMKTAMKSMKPLKTTIM